MGVAANEPKAETPFAAGPVILNVQSSLRRATLTDEIVEFGAWRVFARLALGYGHDPNGDGAADPDGRGPFPTAASEATTRTTIPRLRPGRLLSTDPVRLRPDRGRRVVSDSPLNSVQNGNRSNTCPTPNILSDALCLRHHGHTPRRQCPHQPADLSLLHRSARPHPHNRIASNAKFPGWQQLGVSSSHYQAAENACQDVLAAGIDDQFPPAEVPLLLRGMLYFSQCMRSHGVPNWPDPITNPEGRPVFQLRAHGFSLQQAHSPLITHAADECQHLLPRSEELLRPISRSGRDARSSNQLS